MKIDFNYITEKIKNAEFEMSPFRHIEIEDFFTENHFNEIVKSNEISIPVAESDEQLCNSLLAEGWEPIKFPGGTTNIEEYLAWRKGKAGYDNVETCEGFGIVFRLASPKTDLINQLNLFLKSNEFLNTLAAKFEIDIKKVVPDVGIQKYLDGYEISPHPDIRIKALTFMVNINPHEDAYEKEHHTHYLKFRDEWKYVQEYWKYNTNIDRAWVPWSWCECVKQQKTNNSIVIFQPNSDTMHAVKADYDHLEGQRTQLYGNLWYGSDMKVVFDRPIPQIPWQGLSIDLSQGATMHRTKSTRSIFSEIKSLVRNTK